MYLFGYKCKYEYRILGLLSIISISISILIYHFLYLNDPVYADNRENFESTIFNNIRGKYKRNKRKAVMIKDGFTGTLNHKVKKFVRLYKL